MEMESLPSSCSNSPTSSSPLLIQSPHILYVFKLFFRMLGICTNASDCKYFRYSMLISFLGLIIITLTSIIHSVIEYFYSSKPFQYQIIGVQIWMVYGTTAYGLIAYHMYSNYNYFEFLKYISQPESHHYGQTRTKSASTLTIKNLNKISLRWIIFACGLTFASIIASMITFGPLNLLSTFLPLLHNPLDNFIFIFLFIANMIGPIPMIIVRIGSYFLEQRILGMILYLETEVEKLRTIPIASIMEWYDELYHYNEILTFYLSPFVTLSLLISFPQSIFLLQGLILKEGDYVERITLCFWFCSAVFVLLVTTCSVAQIDALNRRFETALGTIVSRDLFASKETSSYFDLALAKRRSLPFGVVFYATRARVSYSAIYKIATVIISVFVFFVGLSAGR